MKKSDKFIPVITLDFYYGDKPWDGPVSLHEMLNIPPEIAEYVNDYKLLWVEARDNNLCLRNMNNMDLFNLLGYYPNQAALPARKEEELWNMRRNIELLHLC